MTNYSQYLAMTRKKLQKALNHLEYSYQKIQTLSAKSVEQNDETLQTWESFTTRFLRVSDIFLIRYLKAYVMSRDPGFDGSFRDFIHQGEKLGIIDDGKAWLAIRALRNIAAHDYSEEDLAGLFSRLRTEAPRLLKIREQLDAPDSTGD